MAYFDKYGVEFSDDKKTLVRCPQDYIGEYIIPQGVNSIADEAFESCRSLTSVIIPNTVIIIGQGVFSDCRNLKHINLPNSVSNIGDSFEFCCELKIPIYNASCFAYLPPSYSGTYTIPDGITKICKGAFYECKELTSIYIPDSVLSINDLAFAHCESLTSIVIPYGVKVIGECVFKGCKNLIALSIPESVISIKEQAFAECDNLKCINFPNNLEEIETDAFSDCKNLNTIILPESLSYIGARAFSGCIGLKSITNLSKQPQHITEDVFEGVDKTTCKLRIPAESIEDYWLSDGWDLFDNLLYKKDCVISK